ncbi:uncharacterized protein BJ171DRAFT_207331 [Polychytrium aggregatum]|uniref:uncharacterized protein n=1 Tax=Polychytrium aggregatum TaxID=110093 RepID=UPI0022FDE070|nr:uncharacterized protein BJ171DRAFT_207331 [Polychytrium aggregatum]KAI9208428.1 hypothetical protein BJ171DRAFT_207331 [Polychytrium aggregatum]
MHQAHRNPPALRHSTTTSTFHHHQRSPRPTWTCSAWQGHRLAHVCPISHLLGCSRQPATICSRRDREGLPANQPLFVGIHQHRLHLSPFSSSRNPQLQHIPGASMSDEFTNVIDEENVDDSPRILLIGAGISGFALALSIRHASRITQSPVEVHIYEAQSTLAPQPYGLTLWRWAIELLRELGLLTRLEKVSAPIVSFIANDDETRETLVHWKATDPVASTPDSGVGDVRLPPMMGVTKDNLLRLLVIAYAGVSFDDYPAQAPPNWFETEGWAAKIPNLHLSHTLDSFLISSSTGVVTARFTNESLQNGTMLVGCDGVNSKVRSLLCNDHFPPQPAGACVISGLVNTTNPELNRDVPTRLEDGRLIPDLLPHEVQRYVGSGVSRTVTGKGTAFGVTNIGEGVLAWNLVVSQAHPGAQLENFVKAAGLSLGSTGTLQPLSHNANVRRTAIRNVCSQPFPSFPILPCSFLGHPWVSSAQRSPALLWS